MIVPVKPTVEVYHDSGRYYFPAPIQMRAMCQSVMGAKWDRSRKCWYVPATPFCLDALDSVFDFEKDSHIVNLLDRAEEIKCGFSEQDPGMPSSSWEHQRKALHWLGRVLRGGMHGGPRQRAGQAAHGALSGKTVRPALMTTSPLPLVS